jgi:hypothetical protein
MEHYRKSQNLQGVAFARLVAANALIGLRRQRRATAYANESLIFARAHGLRRLTSYALISLCYTSTDAAFAKDCITESRQIAQAMGAGLDATDALTHLGACECALGNPQSALDYEMEWRTEVRSRRDIMVGAINRPKAAIYLAALCRYDEAAEIAREALFFGREHQAEAMTAFALQLLVTIPLLRSSSQRKRFFAPLAARVLGFVNAQLAAIGSRVFMTYYFFDESVFVSRALDVLKVTLGTEVVATLMSDGATMTEDEAVELALRTYEERACTHE